MDHPSSQIGQQETANTNNNTFDVQIAKQTEIQVAGQQTGFVGTINNPSYAQPMATLPTTNHERIEVSQIYDMTQTSPQHLGAQQQQQPMQQPNLDNPLDLNKVQQQSPHVVTMPAAIKPLLDYNTATQSSNGPQVQSANQIQVPGSSPQRAILTKVKLTDELNIFDWMRTKEIISQIAEKARSSVDSVITILDPGMKEYLYSGGNVNIMVIVDSSCLISPIRDSFQSVFGRATVIPARYNPPHTSIDHPIKLALGSRQAVMCAKEKIKKLRLDTNNVPQNQVIAVVQPSLVSYDKNLTAEHENNAQKDELLPKWFFTYCMLIEDPVLNVTINVFSQFIPIDDEVLVQAHKESLYPSESIDKSLGYTVSIDKLMSNRLQLYDTNSDSDMYGCSWLPKWSGCYETQLVHQLSLSLANAYRRKWNECVQIETIS